MSTNDQGLNWRFTEIPPSKIDWTSIQGFKYCVYTIKKGGEGILYSDGYVEFKSNKRYNALKTLLPNASWSIRKGSAIDAIVYCSTKFDNVVEGPYEIGVHSSKKAINTQQLLDNTVQAMIEQRQSYGWILKHCPSEQKDFRHLNHYNMFNWKLSKTKGAFYHPALDVGLVLTDPTYVKKLIEESTEVTQITEHIE